ncbi:MAG: putative RDD family membrane protein YckC [Gammaproteobacteria bacterium]|jgi:uncharacterized RDD family membrane protein YckC
MSEKSKSTAFLGCFFLGMFGVHRFYIGRWKTAVLMLLTLGGLGIWTMIDLMLIIGDKLTDANGDSLRTGPPNPDDTHAGFWVRFAAITVDMMIVYLILIAVSFVGSMALGLGSLATLDFEDPAAVEQFGAASSVLVLLLFVVVVPLYFGLQTASSHQATVGKRIFDIYVCTASGGRLNVLRGLWRAVCYAISSIPLGLGFVLGVLTSNKRALHDYLAGTEVMYVTANTAAGTAAMAQAPRAAEPPVMRASDSAVESSSAGGGDKIIIALGLLLLVGSAALALL